MKQLFLLTLSILLINSCQIEDVEIPDTGRKIVINGLISTDSLLNVRISGSYYLKDNSHPMTAFPEFDSAEACIYKNGICIDSLYHKNKETTYDEVYPASNYNSYTTKPQPGNEYLIKVKRPGFPDATAVTVIPRMVKIERVDTSRIRTVHSVFRMNCSLEFNDPPGEKNYYLVNMIRASILKPRKGYMAFNCNDPIIEEELGSNSMAGEVLKYGYAFSDKLIEGKKYNLGISFSIQPYWDNPLNPNPRNSYIYYFRLISITEDFYRFIHTLNLFNETYMNPLAEPVMVHSNVTGGYGIFSGAAVASDSIILHE